MLAGVVYDVDSSCGDELVRITGGRADSCWTRGDPGQMKRRRIAFAVFTAVALSAAGTVAVATARSAATPSRSAVGSCIRVRPPYLRGSKLYAKAKQRCPGKQKTYVFVQARFGRGSRVYTLAAGSTTGRYLKIGAPRCVYSGTWSAWTLATRGVKSSTSRVITYTCTTTGRAMKNARVPKYHGPSR